MAFNLFRRFGQGVAFQHLPLPIIEKPGEIPLSRLAAKEPRLRLLEVFVERLSATAASL
jgi:hypothetical protein